EYDAAQRSLQLGERLELSGRSAQILRGILASVKQITAVGPPTVELEIAADAEAILAAHAAAIRRDAPHRGILDVDADAPGLGVRGAREEIHPSKIGRASCRERGEIAVGA